MLKETKQSTIERIIASYSNNANAELATRMASYMKSHFSFLGIPKPLRAELSKEFLKEKCIVKSIDWDMVFHLFDLAEREYQYLAMDYLRKKEKQLTKSDISHLEKLLLTKSWWDCGVISNW